MYTRTHCALARTITRLKVVGRFMTTEPLAIMPPKN